MGGQAPEEYHAGLRWLSQGQCQPWQVRGVGWGWGDGRPAVSRRRHRTLCLKTTSRLHSAGEPAANWTGAQKRARSPTAHFQSGCPTPTLCLSFPVTKVEGITVMTPAHHKGPQRVTGTHQNAYSSPTQAPQEPEGC